MSVEEVEENNIFVDEVNDDEAKYTIDIMNTVRKSLHGDRNDVEDGYVGEKPPNREAYIEDG